MALTTEFRTDCRIFGPDTVPWCAVVANGLPVAEHNISPKETSGIVIPTVLVNTGTEQKFNGFKNAYRVVHKVHPDFIINSIVWGKDLLPSHEESKFTHGQNVAEEKADEWWREYYSQRLEATRDDGRYNCMNKYKCWRFPHGVTTDVRVSMNGVGSCRPRMFLDNLNDEIVERKGLGHAKEIIKDEEHVQEYIIQRVLDVFDPNELAVIHLDPGMTVLEMVMNEKTRQVERDGYALVSGRMSMSYSLPAEIFYEPVYWERYFQRIKDVYGGFGALLQTPLGFRFEHVLAVAKELGMDGNDLSASVPREAAEFGLTPQESLEMVAKGFHPSLIRDLFKELKNNQQTPGLRTHLEIGGNSGEVARLVSLS